MIEESTYPKSVFIKLFDNKRTFFYEIIKEGTYPLAEQLYYTKNPKHPIPHNYIVKTQYGKAMHTVKCSIEYMEKRPLYKICFGDNFAREEFNKTKEIGKNQNRNQSNRKNKGKISGPLLFGLKLLSVERVRKTMSLDLKIRPFDELGNSQKRRKILGLSQHVLDIVEKEKGNTFHPDDQIKLKQIKFETYDDIYEINFGKLGKIEEMKKIEAVVKSLDRGHISREAYRSLARIEDLPRENVIFDLLQPTAFEPITGNPDITDSTIIMNMLESIGKGGQRRITDILNYIIPLYIEKGILIPRRSTLHIRISGDGRNKPDNHYTLVLYPGAETYDSLRNALAPLISDLNVLKERDRLWELMISDLRRETADEEIWKAKILLEMQRLNISFQFWHEKNTNNLLYTSLMGPDKLKILKGFDLFAVSCFAKSWLDAFTAPSTGHPNRSNFVRGMYRVQDITPYIHVLCNHAAEFLEIHHEFGLAAFSCSPVEKKNHMQVCLYFQNTLKDGGNKNSRKSAILEMLEHENWQLYFASNKVPNFLKKSKKYRLQ
ncbi:uncharacterized protein OCT59_013261 [Rhizophagus irregularis]|uniref:uncharacterized protein n=1 Tax=Rhizophagus irregularis TaxID=588596 RepID=UPI003333F0B8|nr:hypothetical protein OCT59_013261 [Rhizophagus irregularis]